MVDDFFGFDYFDFGCSSGGFMSHISKLDPSLRGLGIDIDMAKLKQARASGHNVICFDILNIPNEKSVGFVTMSHFLEHLPSFSLAESMIIKAIAISRDFVFIRQPWFDADAYLLRHGFKLFWSHWSGHPNRMTSLELFVVLQKMYDKEHIKSFSIFGRGVIEDSSHPCVIPLREVINQHHYDETKHGAKDSAITFTEPIFQEIVAIAEISIGGSETLSRITSSMGSMRKIVALPG